MCVYDACGVTFNIMSACTVSFFNVHMCVALGIKTIGHNYFLFEKPWLEQIPQEICESLSLFLPQKLENFHVKHRGKAISHLNDFHLALSASS